MAGPAPWSVAWLRERWAREENDRKRAQGMERANAAQFWTQIVDSGLVEQLIRNPTPRPEDIRIQTTSTTPIGGAYFSPASGKPTEKPAPKIPEILPTNRKRKIVFD